MSTTQKVLSYVIVCVSEIPFYENDFHKNRQIWRNAYGNIMTGRHITSCFSFQLSSTSCYYYMTFLAELKQEYILFTKTHKTSINIIHENHNKNTLCLYQNTKLSINIIYGLHSWPVEVLCSIILVLDKTCKNFKTIAFVLCTGEPTTLLWR